MNMRSSRATRYWIADMPQVSLYPMVLMLMVAGCAGSMGVIRPDTATASVTAFDGSYRNTISIAASATVAKGTSWCETPGQPVITVVNGQFGYAVPHPNMPGNPTPTFQAAVARDGSFLGRSNGGTISGQVRGTYIEGIIDGVGCRYTFAGNRM
jgi:hypothetical protein